MVMPPNQRFAPSMSSSPVARLENAVSWFAASVLVTIGTIYALRLQEQRRNKPLWIPPRATPAQEPPALQASRADEHGRGRKANAPVQIPWRGWRDILVRTYHQVENHHLLALSASVAFYSILALFPAIAAGITSYAFFTDVGTVAKHLSIAADIVPSGAIEILSTEITRIAMNSDGKLTLSFVVGLCVALWSANAGMKSIFDALNIIYDEDEKRGLVWYNLVSLFSTTCVIAAGGLAMALVVMFPLLLAAFGLTSIDHPVIAFARWPLMFLMIIVGLAVLYRYGPSRRLAKWRWVSIGSIVAALAWLAGSSLFSWYLATVANYNATYGTLGAVAGLLVWMWLTAIVVLVGAQLNSEIEHQTAQDSTVGAPKPLGHRGAVMADTVGSAVP